MMLPIVDINPASSMAEQANSPTALTTLIKGPTSMTTIRCYFIALTLMISGAGLWGCLPTHDSKFRSGDAPAEEFRDGVLYFENSAVDKVKWNDNGYRLTLGMYYQNYYVNLNRSSPNVVALHGVDGASFDYGGLIYRDLAGVPAADMPQALIKFTFTNTQFLDLDAGAFRYFLEVYLKGATDDQWLSFAGYNSGATATASSQAFHSALSAFLSSLPQK